MATNIEVPSHAPSREPQENAKRDVESGRDVPVQKLFTKDTLRELKQDVLFTQAEMREQVNQMFDDGLDQIEGKTRGQLAEITNIIYKSFVNQNRIRVS